MVRMKPMRHYRRVFPVNLVRIFRFILTMPGSTGIARTNVILWAIATLFAAAGLVLSVAADGWWWINAPVLAVDAVMLKWSLTGLRQRRRAAAREDAADAKLAEFERIIRGLQ